MLLFATTAVLLVVELLDIGYNPEAICIDGATAPSSVNLWKVFVAGLTQIASGL